MLLFPSIIKNLLTISKPTSDNPLSIECYGNICFVKDMKGQILLQGLVEKGFYKLLLKSNHLSSSSTSHSSYAFQISQLDKPISIFSFLNVSSAFLKL